MRVVADHRIRFLVVGGGSAVVELTLFQLLVRAGSPASVANVLSFVVGLLLSFTGYRLWSFAGDHTVSGRAQFAAYLGLALVNVTITSTAIHLLVSAGVVPLVAKLSCMAAVTTWNYLLLNRLVFQRAPTDPGGAAGEPESPLEPR